MKNTIKIELKKSINNKYFIGTLVIAVIIAMLSAFLMINQYNIELDSYKLYASTTQNPDLARRTLFNHWLGGEYSSIFSMLFFFLLPLFATFPFGWSYISEKNSGYIKNVAIRTKKFDYFLAKYIAVFVSGGLVVLIPMLINFLTVALFVPAITPDIFYDIYYAVPLPQIGSALFYTQPFLYVALFMVLDFIFSGLIATASLAVSFFVKNRFAVILIPFFILLAIHYGLTLIPDEIVNTGASVMNFLRPVAVNGFAIWYEILIQGIILFAVTFYITMRKGTKNDVF